MTGEQIRWGFENLDLSAARIKELGFEGMVAPLKFSCQDHQGADQARVQQWDGKAWKVISDYYTADRKNPRSDGQGCVRQVRGGEEDHAARMLEGELSASSSGRRRRRLPFYSESCGADCVACPTQGG